MGKEGKGKRGMEGYRKEGREIGRARGNGRDNETKRSRKGKGCKGGMKGKRDV